jgi:protein adenylyltransferase
LPHFLLADFLLGGVPATILLRKPLEKNGKFMPLIAATDTTPYTSDLGGGQFDNSYARLPQRFYVRLNPTPVHNPSIVKFNSALAEELGLDARQWESETGAAVLAGNHVPEWADPLAMAYAGHQFGNFVPQLGDGRAILLGEIIARDGTRRDLQLKGAGQTPFSRRGDGRAALGPMLREYIVSEAMHALGIPTTRSLAVVTTGDPVFRETTLPGAVLARVAASHIRVGTFEYFAVRDDKEAIRILADYAISRHYPALTTSPNRYLSLLATVCEAQAALVARWLQVGFIHGVMNTDNMTICGETIDYGPCAFMDTYDPATVFSSIDHHGRYAFGNQPRIAHWNLARFADTLLPLLDVNQERAIALAEDAINQFPAYFARYWQAGMRRKLGLTSEQPDDANLIETLLALMQEHVADYTNTFRLLCAVAEGDEALPGYEAWVTRWRMRLGQESYSPHEAATIMRANNPAVIPRNHRVEAALNAAVGQGDFAPAEELLAVLSTPFDLKPEHADYRNPPTLSERVQQTFCGT